MNLPLKLKMFSRFSLIMALCLVLAVPSLLWRISYERSNRSSMILFDLLEMHALNVDDYQDAFTKMMSSGISGFLAPECTGEEIVKGALDGVSVVSSNALPSEIAQANPSSVTVLALSDSTCSSLQWEYLSRRFDGCKFSSLGSTAYVVIPYNWGQLEKSGVLPDLRSIRFLTSFGVPIVISPNLGQYGNLANLEKALDYLCTSFESIKALCPAGEVAPDAISLGKLVKQHDLLMTNVEFSRILGASRLPQHSWPNVVSMHGVDRAEVIKRNIGRTAMLNRFFRAAKEREVKLLVLRLDPLRSSAATLEGYCSDVRSLRSRLDSAGLSRHWPSKAPGYSRVLSVMSAVGILMMLYTLTARLCGRYLKKDYLADWKVIATILVLGAASGVASQFVGIILRLGGAFAAAFLAAEASLLAMDRWKVPLRGVFEVLLLLFCGGCVVGAAFSKPYYMFRLAMFSGVKISLLLPIVIVFFMDLRLHEHPESLPEILKRPPLWGELALAGAILLAGLVMILRSGNYGFVGNTEISIRDWLEDVLVARPRTKEFLIGYPALVIWYYLKRKNYWGHWREVLRIATTLAFSSAVNSFCHFHTPLSLTALRVINGWWIGLVFGCILLLIGTLILRPIAKRAMRLL